MNHAPLRAPLATVVPAAPLATRQRRGLFVDVDHAGRQPAARALLIRTTAPNFPGPLSRAIRCHRTTAAFRAEHDRLRLVAAGTIAKGAGDGALLAVVDALIANDDAALCAHLYFP